MESFSGNAPGVNSLQPGDLFDVALSKKDSSLGLSVTVLFDKVFTLSLFFPFPPHFITVSLVNAAWVWFAILLNLFCSQMACENILFACFLFLIRNYT